MHSVVFSTNPALHFRNFNVHFAKTREEIGAIPCRTTPISCISVSAWVWLNKFSYYTVVPYECFLITSPSLKPATGRSRSACEFAQP
jgi:hypothetical protein